MPNDLFGAIKMDLDNFELKNEDEQKFYVRWLLGEAYMHKDGDCKTHLYIKTKTPDYVRNEIRNYASESKNIYKGGLILNIDELLTKIANAFVSSYRNMITSYGNMVTSFDDVMNKTIEYYLNKNGYDYSDEYELAKLILDNYFNKNNIKVFSAKNGTRNYVSSKSQNQIESEIISRIGFAKNKDELIENYAKKVADDFIKEKMQTSDNTNLTMDDLRIKIEKEIDNLNVNNNLKAYLKGELSSCQFDSLERFISKDLLNSYKNLFNKQESDNYHI